MLSSKGAPLRVVLTPPTQAGSSAMADPSPTELVPRRKSILGDFKDMFSRGRKVAPAPASQMGWESEVRRAPDTAGAGEQPPAYSDVMNAPSGYRPTITTADDPFAFLSTFDTIFVIDDSWSMTKGTSWAETRDALRFITRICTDHDSDGIDLYFLNNKSQQSADSTYGKPGTGYRNLRDSAAVERLFESVRPSGATPTGTRLHHILTPYLRLLERNKDSMENVKPVNIIVITDGDPTDDLEGVLSQAARKLDRLEAPPYQVGVQFFQVGDDKEATKALKELDDQLGPRSEDARDMVDTVTWSQSNRRGNTLAGGDILKVVLGAVVRKLDRQQTEMR